MSALSEYQPRTRPVAGEYVARRVSPSVIREAMDRHGIGMKRLSRATRDVDPDGRGISWQLIGFLASAAPWGRDTTTVESAQLLADALGEDFGKLFARDLVGSE